MALTKANMRMIEGAELVFTEAADHTSTPTAAEGYLWVKSDTPNALLFTDDAGTDYVLTDALVATDASTTFVNANEATAANIRAGAADVIVTPAAIEAAVEEVTLTDAATVAVDWSTFVNGVVTLAGNRTLGAPTNAEPGTTRVIRVVQDATGSRTLSFNAVYLFPGGTAPTMSTAANSKDTLYIYCETTSLFHVTHQLDFS
jgi:hypothetical protein